MIRKLLVALIWKNPFSPYGNIRWLWLALIILFTLYAPIELTGVIIHSWDFYGLLPSLVFEVSIIWLGYLAGMCLVWRLIKRG